MHQVDKATFLPIVFLAFVLYVGGFLFLNSTYLYTSIATIKRWSRLFIKKCGYTNVDFFLTELYKISLLLGMAAFSVFLLRAQVAVDVATAAALEVERLAAIALEADRLAALALEEARLEALKLSAAADLIKPTRPAWWAYAPLITVTAVGAIICFPPLIHVFTFPGSLVMLRDLLSTPQETLEALTEPGAEVYDPGTFVLVTSFVAPLLLVPACGLLSPWYAAMHGFIDPTLVVPALNALGHVPPNVVVGAAAILGGRPTLTVLELLHHPSPIGEIVRLLGDCYDWTPSLCRTFSRGAYFFNSLQPSMKSLLSLFAGTLRRSIECLFEAYKNMAYVEDLVRDWNPIAHPEYIRIRARLDLVLDVKAFIQTAILEAMQPERDYQRRFIARIVSMMTETTNSSFAGCRAAVATTGRLFIGA